MIRLFLWLVATTCTRFASDVFTPTESYANSIHEPLPTPTSMFAMEVIVVIKII